MKFQINEIDSKAELMELFRQVSGPKLLIENGETSPNQFKLIRAFGITIALIGHSFGVPIQIDELENGSSLLIGHGSEIACISVKKANLLWQINLDSVFFKFQKILQPKYIVLIEETGVHAIDFSGKRVWNYPTDVITDAQVSDSEVSIKTMDDQEFKIDIHTGRRFR